MNSPIVMVIVIVAVLAAIGFGIWAIMRARYVSGLRKRGWEFVTSPEMREMGGLNCPPFGMGLGRDVDDLVRGTSSGGVPFRAIEYDCDGWKSDHYVVIFPLPSPMPHVHATPASRASRNPWLPTGGQAQVGGHVVRGADPGCAQQVGAIMAGNAALANYEMSVDHANFVVFDVRENADELAKVVEAGAEVARGIANLAPQFPAQPAPQYVAFAHRPTWQYIGRDDTWLNSLAHNTSGHSHEAHDVVRGQDGPISFIRLEHRWKTTHTDSKGNTSTRNHKEFLCEFRHEFPFGELDLGSNMLGIRNDRSGLQFESSAFNSRYRVRAASRKFAYDVLHPRMMEWLLSQDCPQFNFVGNGRIRVKGQRWDVAELDHNARQLRDFFARVPDFVWQNNGVWPRPIPAIDEA